MLYFRYVLPLLALLIAWSPGVGAAVQTSEYVVAYAAAVPPAKARAALAAAGARVLSENEAVGVATIRTARRDFGSWAAARPELLGVARSAPVGQASQFGGRAPTADAAAFAAPGTPSATDGEPLADRQWNMQLIHAPAANRRFGGDPRVLVGVIDTGIDGSHPDIAPNFSRELSRNFVPDGDAVDVDEQGHGTHVAGIIAAPLNGIGIAGVAPQVTLVNLRAGNDGGFFFLQPMVDALTYAGDVGIDVVNMSLYIDPWLFNCPDNPADAPEAQQEQRTIIEATQRALRYARERGVTLIAAAGNNHGDLGRPEVDESSPNFPPDRTYRRDVDNGCLNLPAEGEGVISVTSLGPSGRKAYYSDYGLEQADLAAPGGDLQDYPGSDRFRRPENLVLAPFPRAVLEAEGALAADGSSSAPDVVVDCQADGCSYYRYLQGTSMAAPHAAGVAALLVSRYGRPDPAHPDGLTLPPATVERLLQRSAMQRSCPDGAVLTYPGLPEYAARCEGGSARNGFYGAGIVNAWRAVAPLRPLRPSRLLPEDMRVMLGE